MDRNERKTNSRGHTITMDRESKYILRKIILDFAIIFIIGFLILVFYLWGSPYERGFFCDDESLKHPYKESTVTNIMLYMVGLGLPVLTVRELHRRFFCDHESLKHPYKESTVTNIMLYMVGLGLPVLTMCLTEWLRLRDYKGGRSREVLGREVPAWAWEAYHMVGVFLFGCACQQLTTDIAKYTIGRLRPHFFDVCKPDIDCSLPENKWRYIEKFQCLGNDEKLLKEMRLSFPSGHSSFSAYTMIYFAMYLHKRFTWRGSKLLRHGIQFVLVMLAWYTVMTRVSDYKHHWSDVMAGFSVGLLYAVIVFSFISGLRKSSRRSGLGPDAELHPNGTHAPRVQV